MVYLTKIDASPPSLQRVRDHGMPQTVVFGTIVTLPQLSPSNRPITACPAS